MSIDMSRTISKVTYGGTEIPIKETVGNISGETNTYFSEKSSSGSFVRYLFRVIRNLNSQTTTVSAMTSSVTGTVLRNMMTSTDTIALSHTDYSNCRLDYGTPYEISISDSNVGYSTVFGTISSVARFKKSDGITDFVTADIVSSKNYRLEYTDVHWDNSYSNITNFSLKIIVTEQ